MMHRTTPISSIALNPPNPTPGSFDFPPKNLISQKGISAELAVIDQRTIFVLSLVHCNNPRTTSPGLPTKASNLSLYLLNMHIPFSQLSCFFPAHTPKSLYCPCPLSPPLIPPPLYLCFPLALPFLGPCFPWLALL